MKYKPEEISGCSTRRKFDREKRRKILSTKSKYFKLISPSGNVAQDAFRFAERNYSSYCIHVDQRQRKNIRLDIQLTFANVIRDLSASAEECIKAHHRSKRAEKYVENFRRILNDEWQTHELLIQIGTIIFPDVTVSQFRIE